MQDRVAFDYASLAGIVDRPIERVCKVADQGACRVARQLRVGIQGDDVLDRSENRLITDDIRKGRLRPAPESGIELLQFAALALIPHPQALELIPHPGPVKQIEDARAILAVALVERLHCGACMGEQGLVVRQRLLGCIAKIRQQRKEQIGIAIAEIAYLHGLEQIIDVLRPCQQGGNNHHGAMAVWNPFGKIHSWQRARRQGERDQQIHQRDGQRRGADDKKRRKKPDPPATRIKPAKSG